MKSWKIAKYILVLTLLGTGNRLVSQENTEYWVRGIRVGYDISRLALYQFQPERKAYELSFDTEWKPNYFAALELGKEDVFKEIRNSASNTLALSYNSSGYYGRIGFDHNILRRDDLKHRDVVYTGLRYGFYAIKQQTSTYTISEDYWANITSNVPSETLTGHWFEAIFGAKVEMFRNLYVGGSARFKVRLYTQDGRYNYPLAMPGFGDGSRKTMFGLTYSIYYQIPLMKVKIEKPVAKKDTKKIMGQKK